MRLENSECSVNTGSRVLAAPVLRDLEATFGVIVPRAAVQPVPVGSSAAQRSPSWPRAGPSPSSCTRRDGGGAAGRRQAWAEDGSQRMRKSQIEKPRDRIALSRFCYRRRKPLVPQGPRKLPKLDVAGSTPVARSLRKPLCDQGVPVA